MIRAYRYRLYPTEQQKAYFARCFGATRYCYNYCVRQYDAACLEGRQLSGFDVAALLREHTKDLAWMTDVDYEIKESAPRRFDNALGKYKRHEANRPREHKKGERPYMSYTTGGVIRIDFKHDLVQLPKIGLVSARLHRSFAGEIMSATIKREADGNYYVSLNVNNGEPAAPLKPHTTVGTVGIDVGIRHLATLSNGDHFEMPDMSRITDRIAFLKKRLEKQQPGSRRYKRTSFQIAKLQHHIANISKDTHHKAAAKLCRCFDTICMETLSVEGMKRGQQCQKTAADIVFNAQLHRMALALFIDRIQKKAEETGTNFVSIDRWEPTTKMCHVCGHVLDSISLDVAKWTCPECGTRHDRDENAAINIRNKGIEMLQAKQPKVSRTNTLPLAEGNVMPAKKTTAGCNLRTGKGKAEPDQPPKAQIADGTAPPRFFKKPKFETPLELNYFKISPLITRAAVTPNQYSKWLEQLTYGEIPDEMKTIHNRILTAIRQVSDELRRTKIKYDKDRSGSQEVLGKMNKVVRADWLIAEELTITPNFTIWRSKKRKPQEIQIINRIVTREFPDRLDDMVSRLKAYAYEEKQEQRYYTITADESILKSKCFCYLKVYRVARKSGVKTFAIERWQMFRYKYGERYFSFKDVLQTLHTLKEYATQLRGMEITETSQKGIERQLKALEQDVWMDNVLRNAGLFKIDNERMYKEAYAKWRAAFKTTVDVQKINQLACYELPELIDRFVASELSELHWEMQNTQKQ